MHVIMEIMNIELMLILIYVIYHIDIHQSGEVSDTSHHLRKNNCIIMSLFKLRNILKWTGERSPRETDG